jgi:hypothetical protein
MYSNPRRQLYVGTPGHPLLPRRQRRFGANDNWAYVPEVWAQEGVKILWEEMIFPQTIHTDFNNEVARFGETVHTRKPAEFEAQRKQNDLDDVNTSDASSTDIEVVLNQRIYTSFVLGDGEMSKSFQDLVRIYLLPAMRSNARLVDQAIGGQVYQYMANQAGALGTMTTSNSHGYMLDTRNVMNKNKVPNDQRWFGWTSDAETILQKTDIFKKADEIGDGGRALREAYIGRLAGFNNFYELNLPSVSGATQSTATTTTAAVAAGASTVPVTATTGMEVGTWITAVGAGNPMQITAIATLDLTVSPVPLNGIASGAAVQIYTTKLVDQAAAIPAGDKTAAVTDGYPAGWMTDIHIDSTGAVVPQVGQLVSFATAGSPNVLLAGRYCILQVTNTASNDYDILLDRPLETAIANNDVVCLGPDGDYNFAYRRNALAMVNRPLYLPASGIGVKAATGQDNGIALRVTITYDGVKEATRITIGSLFGLKVLDVDQGAVCYS